MSALTSQFSRPTGLLGSLAGRVMAYENRSLNERVVDELTLAPGHHVLELGCGPGIGIAAAAARAREGLVVGVDPSPVMVRQARRRNAAAIAAGRVIVELAAAERLPFPDNHFDRVFAVNSVQHWRCVHDGIAELHRVLAPSGSFLLARRLLRTKGSGFDPHRHGATTEQLEQLHERLEEAGSVDVHRQVYETRREAVAFVSGLPPPVA